MRCPTGNLTNRMRFAGLALVQRCAHLRRSALAAPHRTKATTEKTVERGPSKAKILQIATNNVSTTAYHCFGCSTHARTQN